MFDLSWWEKFENSIVFELLITGFFFFFFLNFGTLIHLNLVGRLPIVLWRDSKLAAMHSMLS